MNKHFIVTDQSMQKTEPEALLCVSSCDGRRSFLSDLADVACERLNLAVETIRFLSWLLVHHPTVLGGTQWDFVLCSVLAWLEVTSGVLLSSRRIRRLQGLVLLFPDVQ